MRKLLEIFNKYDNEQRGMIEIKNLEIILSEIGNFPKKFGKVYL